MLGMAMAWALLAAAQDKPLAGSLPPLPAPRPSAPDDRPRGKLFISPMGEPFRGPDPVRQWFDAADADRDGALTPAEFVADVARFFAILDRGKDGEIDPDDIEYYETVLAPEIRTGGDPARGYGGRRGGAGGGRRGGGRRGGGGGGGYRGGGGQNDAGGQAQRYGDVRRGAARFGFFDYPEPVVVADTNFNRGIDPQEFRAAALDRFAALDKNHDGRIGRGELPRLAAAPAGRFGRGAPDGRRFPDRGGAAPDEEEAPDR